MDTGIIIELLRPTYIKNYKIDELLKEILEYCEIGSEIDYIYDTIEEPNSYLALGLWYQDLEIAVNNIKKLVEKIDFEVIDFSDYYCFKIFYSEGMNQEVFELIRKRVQEYSILLQEELLNVTNGIINGYDKNEYYYDAERFINNIYMMNLLLNNLLYDLEHKSIKENKAELKIILIDYIKYILDLKKYNDFEIDLRKFGILLQEENVINEMESATLNTYLNSLDMIDEEVKKDKKLLCLKKRIKKIRKS